MSEPADKSAEKPEFRFPKEYGAGTPEMIERRRKLFAAINAGRTKETDAAAQRAYEHFFSRFK